MIVVVKQLVAGPVRYVARQILQRPWLKDRVRDMVMRFPRLHSLVMGVMLQPTATAKHSISGDEKDLSLNAHRAYRALKQAIRTHQR
jgi:hypothetical protein